MQRTFVVIAIAFFVACITRSLQAEKREDPKEAIQQANLAFSKTYRKGDAKSVSEMYTLKGQLFPPHQKLVTGRADIETFWKAAMDAGILAVDLHTAEVDLFDDSIVESGSYMLFGKENRVLDRGKYLVLWKRVDGVWKLHRDCWNSDEPAPMK